MSKWTRLLNLFVIALGTTTGVVLVLLATAKTPDADEFARGIPAGLVGATIAWIIRGLLPAAIETPEPDDAE